MERHELIGLMRDLKLAGMRAAYDDVMRSGLQHQRSPAEILGDLLKAEFAEKAARSIRYQMGAARFPVMKTLAEFDFDAVPVNEAMVRSLHAGDFLDQARNAVLVGGTGTGKSQVSIAVPGLTPRGRAGSSFSFDEVIEGRARFPSSGDRCKLPTRARPVRVRRP